MERIVFLQILTFLLRSKAMQSHMLAMLLMNLVCRHSDCKIVSKFPIMSFPFINGYNTNTKFSFHAIEI